MDEKCAYNDNNDAVWSAVVTRGSITASMNVCSLCAEYLVRDVDDDHRLVQLTRQINAFVVAYPKIVS